MTQLGQPDNSGKILRVLFLCLVVSTLAAIIAEWHKHVRLSRERWEVSQGSTVVVVKGPVWWYRESSGNLVLPAGSGDIRMSPAYGPITTRRLE